MALKVKTPYNIQLFQLAHGNCGQLTYRNRTRSASIDLMIYLLKNVAKFSGNILGLLTACAMLWPCFDSAIHAATRQNVSLKMKVQITALMKHGSHSGTKTGKQMFISKWRTHWLLKINFLIQFSQVLTHVCF